MNQPSGFFAAMHDAIASLAGWLLLRLAAVAGGIVAGWMVESGSLPTRSASAPWAVLCVTPLASIVLGWGAITYLGVAVITFVGCRVESPAVRYWLLLAVFAAVLFDTWVLFSRLHA